MNPTIQMGETVSVKTLACYELCLARSLASPCWVLLSILAILGFTASCGDRQKPDIREESFYTAAEDALLQEKNVSEIKTMIEKATAFIETEIANENGRQSKQDSEDVEYLTRADCYLALGEHEKAFDDATEAFNRKPLQSTAILRAHAAFMAGKDEVANEIATEYSTLDRSVKPDTLCRARVIRVKIHVYSHRDDLRSPRKALDLAHGIPIHSRTIPLDARISVLRAQALACAASGDFLQAEILQEKAITSAQALELPKLPYILWSELMDYRNRKIPVDPRSLPE